MTTCAPDPAGLRRVRELGRGRGSIVYEAVQINLGRHVAVKLLEADPLGGRELAWPEHPHVVSLYATGAWGEGRFVVMQLVPGASLDRLRPAPARALDLLAGVAAALDAGHRAGLAHGDVRAGNVLVDESARALLSDWGLVPGTPAADRRAFARLVRERLGDRVPALPAAPERAGELIEQARAALRPPRRRRHALVAGGAGLLAAAAGLAVLLGGGDAPPEPVPAPQPGTQVLGSALAAGGVRSVDCAGRAPSGASQACTVVQTRLPGRPVVVPSSGAIRRWTVRGARGEVALQVVRLRGERWAAVARTRLQRVRDGGLHMLPANLAVRAGDRLGLELAPGAAVGVRQGVTGAATARWLGRLGIVPRPVELGPDSGFDHELLLRVDYAPGARTAAAGRLSGAQARAAPDGAELDSRLLDVRGAVRRVAAVRLPRTVAVDLFAGSRRLARLPVPGADPGGRLVSLSALGGTYPELRWRNPGGTALSYTFAVGTRTLTPRG